MASRRTAAPGKQVLVADLFCSLPSITSCFTLASGGTPRLPGLPTQSTINASSPLPTAGAGYIAQSPSHSSTTRSRLGPKSQGVGHSLLRFRCMFILSILLLPTALADTDARVDADSPPASGALRGELLGGSTARTTTFSAPNSGRQRIRKRAFARALR